MDRILARKLLTNCRLREGVLSFDNATKEEVKQMHRWIDTALLDGTIPHWKIMGIKFTNNMNTSEANYLSKIYKTNKSYAEVFKECNQIILSGVEVTKQIEVEGNLREAGKLIALGGEMVTSESFYNESDGLRNTVDSLIKHVNLIDMSNSSAGIQLLVCKSVGVIDFPLSSKIIGSLDYKPVRAVYDLNSLFCIKLYEEGEKQIRLLYKKPVNEIVLEKIIKSMADCLEE